MNENTPSEQSAMDVINNALKFLNKEEKVSIVQTILLDMIEPNLTEAAEALYKAGFWTNTKLPVEEQNRLWQNLRDAIGLPAGTATQLGLIPPGENYNEN